MGVINQFQNHLLIPFRLIITVIMHTILVFVILSLASIPEFFGYCRGLRTLNLHRVKIAPVCGSMSALNARKRKVTKATASVPKPQAIKQEDNSPGGVLDFNQLQQQDIELLSSSDYVSKLPPLTGTFQSKMAEYEKKSWFDKTVGEYTAPTPAGEEPKLVKTMKSITWIAVLILVLTEIVVSLKVGGAPFQLESVKLPDLNVMKMFTGGAGPPPLD